MKLCWILPSIVGLALGACSPAASDGENTNQGGQSGSGGASGNGGSTGAGGSTQSATGGTKGTGGLISTGGTSETGGTTARTGGTTGTPATGGIMATGGTLATGGTSATGGSFGTGGSSATGGSFGTGGNSDAGVGRDTGSSGGMAATGGSKGTGGSAATGGTMTTGGTKSTGGTTATGGSATGGSSGNPPPAGKVFSQCRFHFGTIDSQAKSGGASLISQLDYFTPGWMMGTFNQGYVCTEAVAGGALAGLVPVDVTYISANYVKSQNKLCDCNVSGCAGGNLCQYGSQYITQDWAGILAAYTSNSTGFANCLGGKPIIFEMEPDWYQYTGGGQTQPWSPQDAGTKMTALVNALKSSLPNAVFSMDISPWIPNNGQAWYPNFNMSLFTFINTSGGGTDAGNTKIRSNNAMTWAGVSKLTGKPILADTGYGANGGSAGHDAAWDVPANINARIADGVVSIAQYNPKSGWGSTISSIRGQLNTPSVCP